MVVAPPKDSSRWQVKVDCIALDAQGIYALEMARFGPLNVTERKSSLVRENVPPRTEIDPHAPPRRNGFHVPNEQESNVPGDC